MMHHLNRPAIETNHVGCIFPEKVPFLNKTWVLGNTLVLHEAPGYLPHPFESGRWESNPNIQGTLQFFYKNFFYSWASVFLIFGPKVASNVLKSLQISASRFLIFLVNQAQMPLEMRSTFNKSANLNTTLKIVRVLSGLNLITICFIHFFME